LEPQSLLASLEEPDRRLSALIARARTSFDSETSPDPRDREPKARDAARLYLRLAEAIESALPDLDQRSEDYRALQRLSEALRRRSPDAPGQRPG
jgi:hypothetical protein